MSAHDAGPSRVACRPRSAPLAQLTQGVIGLALLLVGHEDAPRRHDVGARGQRVRDRHGRRSAGAGPRARPARRGAGADRVRRGARRRRTCSSRSPRTATGTRAVRRRPRWSPGSPCRRSPPRCARRGRTAARRRGAAGVRDHHCRPDDQRAARAGVVHRGRTAVASPTAAMLTVAGVAVVATVLFAWLCRTCPRIRHGGPGRRCARYLPVLALTLLIGVVIGTLEVAAPAIAIGAGHPGAAGPARHGGDARDAAAARSCAIRRPVAMLVARAVVQLVGASALLVPASLALTAAALVVLGARRHAGACRTVDRAVASRPAARRSRSAGSRPRSGSVSPPAAPSPAALVAGRRAPVGVAGRCRGRSRDRSRARVRRARRPVRDAQRRDGSEYGERRRRRRTATGTRRATAARRRRRRPC